MWWVDVVGMVTEEVWGQDGESPVLLVHADDLDRPLTQSRRRLAAELTDDVRAR